MLADEQLNFIIGRLLFDFSKDFRYFKYFVVVIDQNKIVDEVRFIVIFSCTNFVLHYFGVYTPVQVGAILHGVTGL